MDDILLADHENPAIVSRPSGKDSIVVSKLSVQVANETGDMPHLFWSTETLPHVRSLSTPSCRTEWFTLDSRMSCDSKSLIEVPL